MEEDLKSLARTLVGAVNTVAAIAAALYFVYVGLKGEAVRPVLLESSKGLLALVGGGVLLLNFVRILYFRAGRRREVEGPLFSHTDEGIVQVSRETVESGLRAAGEALEEVTRLRVKVLTPARKKHLVRAHYLAPEGVQILDLSSRLRHVLLDRFDALVQMEKDGKLEVEMIFEGFYGKLRPKAPEPEAQAEATEKAPEAPPFTGPRYPIDVEGESL